MAYSSSFLQKTIYLTAVGLLLLVVVHADEEQVALIVGERIEVLPVSDLVEGGFFTAVSLELDDHGGLIRDEGDEDHVGVAFAGG